MPNWPWISFREKPNYKICALNQRQKLRTPWTNTFPRRRSNWRKRLSQRNQRVNTVAPKLAWIKCGIKPSRLIGIRETWSRKKALFLNRTQLWKSLELLQNRREWWLFPRRMSGSWKTKEKLLKFLKRNSPRKWTPMTSLSGTLDVVIKISICWVCKDKSNILQRLTTESFSWSITGSISWSR